AGQPDALPAGLNDDAGRRRRTRRGPAPRTAERLMRPVRVVPAAGLLVLSLTLAAQAEPKLPADPELTKSDTVLLQDETKAIAELQRRLRSQVGYQNGLFVIVDRSGMTQGVTVMPATVMWSVDCGDSGVSATFGAGSGDTDNGVVLQLTGAAVSDEK